MKIKLDENLPGRLAARLAVLGHDVHTVRQEGLEGHLDETVWEAAQNESRFMITQDLIFPTLGAMPQGLIMESC